jgi:hypothetical protein
MSGGIKYSYPQGTTTLFYDRKRKQIKNIHMQNQTTNEYLKPRYLCNMIGCLTKNLWPKTFHQRLFSRSKYSID